MNYPEGVPDAFRFARGSGENRRWESVDFAETWFPDAFIGPMSSLMRVVGGEIEEAETSVRDNLKTLRLVFGAYQSMESRAVVQLAQVE